MANSTEQVRIRVKSASHRCEDIEISCELGSSVMNVKQIIKDRYPLHPEVREQRIIYAGHLLEDDQILRDIFAQGGQVSVSGGYTFHLACNSTFLRTISRSINEDENKPSEVRLEECTVQERQSSPPGVAVGGIPQDMLALHQLYVEQMMSFMSQWNQGIMTPTWLPSPTPPIMQGPQVQLAYHLRHAAPMPPQADPPVINEQNVVPPPAPVPRINDDDEPPRDILDWLYTCSRFILILSVVYFYSNFSRFILVLLFTALVMIAQRRPGLLNAFRAQPQANPPPAAAAPPQAQDQPARDETNVPRETREEDIPNPAIVQPGEAQAEDDSQAPPPSPPEELPAAEAQAQQQQRFHPFDITRTFLMTFFTSLIPEINPN